MKFRDLRRLLSSFGIEWDERRGKGSHGAFVGLTKNSRIRQVYTLPKDQQKKVSSVYLKPLRRTFELTAQDGVPDDRFN